LQLTKDVRVVLAEIARYTGIAEQLPEIASRQNQI
jgi:hypothetical protein